MDFIRKFYPLRSQNYFHFFKIKIFYQQVILENAVTDTMKTPFSLRFTNIDFTSDFNNLNSGTARKLHDQIYDDLSRVFENTLG